ncbi:Multiple epidermal growth factor-like domains protein 6, partial [Ophiophagus hannah]
MATVFVQQQPQGQNVLLDPTVRKGVLSPFCARQDFTVTHQVCQLQAVNVLLGFTALEGLLLPSHLMGLLATSVLRGHIALWDLQRQASAHQGPSQIDLAKVQFLTVNSALLGFTVITVIVRKDLSAITLSTLARKAITAPQAHSGPHSTAAPWGPLEPNQGDCAAGFWCKGGAHVPNPTDGVSGQPCPAGHYCLSGFIALQDLPPQDPLMGFQVPPVLKVTTVPQAVKPQLPVFLAPTWQRPMEKNSAPHVQKGSIVDLVICHSYVPKFRLAHALLAITVQGVPLFPILVRWEHLLLNRSYIQRYFCLQNSSSLVNSQCPVGHYCPPSTRSKNQFPCPQGTYNPNIGISNLSLCLLCTPGYFCDGTGLVSPAGLCDSGFYCSGGAISPRPDLTIFVLLVTTVPKGVQNLSCVLLVNTKMKWAKVCAKSALQERGGNENENRLNIVGFIDRFCDPSFQTRDPRSSRRTSPGVINPTDCLPGYYCLSGTKTAKQYPCPAGTFSNQTGLSSFRECEPCPGGKFCARPGTCQAGFYCDLSSSHPDQNLCPPGFYCPQGTGTPLQCMSGTINPHSGKWDITDCKLCPAGNFCSGAGKTAPEGRCSPGFYCPPGQVSSTPSSHRCPRGFYCLEGSVEPVACEKGTYQSEEGKESCDPCPARFFCEPTNDSNSVPCPNDGIHGYRCPKGFYCPQGTSSEVPCEPGMFSPTDGASVCLPCPAGTTCRRAAMVEPAICPRGYYCPAQTAMPIPCPAGLLNALEGASSFNACKPCPVGSYCRGDANWKPNGFYCPEGSTAPIPCPEDTIGSHPGAKQKEDCLPCPPGRWCKTRFPMAFPCPFGSNCQGMNLTNPLGPRTLQQCPKQIFRTELETEGQLNCQLCMSECQCPPAGATTLREYPCAPGHWCPSRKEAFLCPPGSYRTQPGAISLEDCLPCPPGFVCPDPEKSGMPNVLGLPCEAGYECPLGSSHPSKCRPGSLCGPRTGMPPLCPAGYYCPEGSSAYEILGQLCVYPYYCPPGSAQPQLCQAGYVALNVSGLRDSSEKCCRACDAGTYKNSLDSHPSCLPCPAGFSCPPGTASFLQHPCPQGYFCPPQTSSPAPCPPGTYGNSSLAKYLEECNLCPAGFFNHIPAQTGCFPCGSSSTSREEPGTYVFRDNAVESRMLIVVVNEQSLGCDPHTTSFQPSSPYQLARHGVLKHQVVNIAPDWPTIATSGSAQLLDLKALETNWMSEKKAFLRYDMIQEVDLNKLKGSGEDISNKGTQQSENSPAKSSGVLKAMGYSGAEWHEATELMKILGILLQKIQYSKIAMKQEKAYKHAKDLSLEKSQQAAAEKQRMDTHFLQQLLLKNSGICASSSSSSHRCKDEGANGEDDNHLSLGTSKNTLVATNIASLSPQRFVVYRFGCTVAHLMGRIFYLPALVLLLAEAIPQQNSKADQKVTWLTKDWYYDANNHFLYILSTHLENAGEFVAVLLNAMAHIKAGHMEANHITPGFWKELNKGITALADAFFHCSWEAVEMIEKSLNGVSLERLSSELLKLCMDKRDRRLLLDGKMKLIVQQIKEGAQHPNIQRNHQWTIEARDISRNVYNCSSWSWRNAAIFAFFLSFLEQKANLFNIHCKIQILLDGIKHRCGREDKEDIELADESGQVKNLLQNKYHYATELLGERETYVLLHVTSISNTSPHGSRTNVSPKQSKKN